MTHINYIKLITLFQTTPQTPIIKTKILVFFDRFLKVQLIIINNILIIVSRITYFKSTYPSILRCEQRGGKWVVSLARFSRQIESKFGFV